MSAEVVSDRFAKNLARHREAVGLSQEELAARADVHRTLVSLIEGGKRMPRLDTLIKLAGGLEIEVAALLVGLRWEPAEIRPGRFTDAAD